MSARGRPFPKGIGGNPKGRAPGSVNKVTLAVRKLMAAKGPKIARKLIEDAEGGDRAAQLLVLRFFMPKTIASAALNLDLRKVTSVLDVPAVISAIGERMSEGLLTPAEAAAAASVYNAYGIACLNVDHEQRMRVVEERLGITIEATPVEDWQGNGAAGNA
jgi:hypothetical protein